VYHPAVVTELSHYVVHVHHRAGTTDTGHAPSFDAHGSSLRFAPRPGAPPSAQINLGEVKVARFVPGEGAAPLDAPDGPRVSLELVDKSAIAGALRPVAQPGGLWLREDGQVPGALSFVPHKSIQAVRYLHKTIAFEGLRISGAAPAPKPSSPAPAADANLRIAANPFEAPTIGEFEALDPSLLKKS
jgi:hypothetical protein